MPSTLESFAATAHLQKMMQHHGWGKHRDEIPVVMGTVECADCIADIEIEMRWQARQVTSLMNFHYIPKGFRR